MVMITNDCATRIAIKKILYLTDFSGPSEAALPFLTSIARNYGAAVNALHVMVPSPIICGIPDGADTDLAQEEEFATSEMQKLDSQLAGTTHETNVEWGSTVWSIVEGTLKEEQTDLIIAGTHGRTGPQKLLLGSVAEDIFRKSPVPVLTIGPSVNRGAHNDGKFHSILLATDFGEGTGNATRYAVSFAQENQAALTLLHVLNGPRRLNGNPPPSSAAEILHRLMDTIGPDADLWCRPEPAIEYGEPAKGILRAAKARGADLIVLGLHNRPLLPGASHSLRATAHKVVVHSPCPVLTVRS
jgi:nucleotide-binding universal stress UspA family protein